MLKCGIIGYPLKKPRSISLWKKYFTKKKINSKMFKFDFNKNQFDRKIIKLLNDKNFLASAITMPYKMIIKDYIHYFNETAKLSGSVNLIIKYKKKIYGFNTDIYGFLKSLSAKISMKNIIIIGMGGSGTAIYNFLDKKYKKKFILITKKNLKKKNNIQVYKSLNILNLDLKKKYLIINCSPVGSDLKKQFIQKTPIDEEIISKISKKCFVFDLVYKPLKTKLFYQCKKYKIGYKGGLEMNTHQGSKALDIISRLTKFRLN